MQTLIETPLMRRLPVLLASVLALSAALVLSACDRTAGQPAAAPAQVQPAGEVKVDKEFGDKVHAYLLQHPEVLIEMSQALETKQAEAAAAKTRANLPKARVRLERDSRDFVANPKGRVTVVEFYDYNCGYCKLIAPEVMAIVRDNPNVRFVFKDYTLGRFGPTSEYAAAAARALKDKGVFLAAHAEMMSRKPLTDAMVDDLLRRNGIEPSSVRALEATGEQKKYLEDVRALAGDLGLDGTPAFVVGDTVVPGADPERLKAAIAAALAG
jgi:protein-disulfide isomerase